LTSPIPTILPCESKDNIPETYKTFPALAPGEYGAKGGAEPLGIMGLKLIFFSLIVLTK
jgi:hypothetical protein